MVRPRRQFSGQEVVVPRRGEWYEDMGWTDVPGTRRSQRWISQRRMSYKTLNGYRDPLTYLLVVDALLRIDTQIELRSSNLADWMNQTYSQMRFDATTVGRVLLDLQESLDTAGYAFLNDGRDWKGRFYLMDPTEGNVKLLWSLRDDLARLSEIAIAAKTSGRSEKMIDTPLLECPSLRGETVELA